MLLGRKMSKVVADGDTRGYRYVSAHVYQEILNSYSNYSTHTNTQPLPVCLMQTGLSK